jgi:hypothetical protein
VKLWRDPLFLNKASNQIYTWKPIYPEIADKLPQFESKNSELVQLMTKLHQRGLKVSSVAAEYPRGTKVPLDEINPFSFLAIFNRGIKKTRGLSLGFVFDQRPKFNAKARSSQSLRTR